MISQILANRISVSYSNFNWTIKAIIGAKFNIKHRELLLSFQFINLIRAEFGKFFDHFIWKRLIWNELVTFFKSQLSLVNSGTKTSGEKSHIAEVYEKGNILFICLQWNLY